MEDTIQKAKDHDHARMKVEEEVCLTLEAGHIVEEEDLGLKAKEARLKAETEEQARL